MRIFGREPALWLALFAAGVQLVSVFLFDLTVDQQGTLNAVAVGAMGVLTAFAVARDQIAPAVMGLLQVLLALGLAFGLNWPPETQAVVMAFAAAAVGMFTRTQVTAPVPPMTARTLSR